MKHLFLSLAAALLCCTAAALEPVMTVRLYPAGTPDSNGYSAADEYSNDRLCFYNTSDPRIDLYLPKGKKECPTILVCPGGGYRYTSTQNEGLNVAEFFVPRGYAVAVLKYRLPNGHENIPLEDAVRGMKILRDSAAGWHLDPHRIGVMGFSAGGHLAASLLTKTTQVEDFTLPSGDDIRSARPDFGVLVYPVITTDPTVTHKGSCTNLMGENPTDEQRERWAAERHVTNRMPPCFLVACQDDKTVPVENSIRFYQALTAAGVPSSMLFLPVGRHGWGFLRHFPQRELFEHALLSFLSEQ